MAFDITRVIPRGAVRVLATDERPDEVWDVVERPPVYDALPGYHDVGVSSSPPSIRHSIYEGVRHEVELLMRELVCHAELRSCSGVVLLWSQLDVVRGVLLMGARCQAPPGDSGVVVVSYEESRVMS